jgi:hypothetical protein
VVHEETEPITNSKDLSVPSYRKIKAVPDNLGIFGAERKGM